MCIFFDRSMLFVFFEFVHALVVEGQLVVCAAYASDILRAHLYNAMTIVGKFT